MSNVISYRRNDGVVGVGFLIEFGGIQQHSVAWPDRPCERFSQQMLDANFITAEPATPTEPILDEAQAPLAPILPNEKQDNPSEASVIRDYLAVNPEATNAEVIDALSAKDVVVTSSQVSKARKA